MVLMKKMSSRASASKDGAAAFKSCLSSTQVRSEILSVLVDLDPLDNFERLDDVDGALLGDSLGALEGRLMASLGTRLALDFRLKNFIVANYAPSPFDT